MSGEAENIITEYSAFIKNLLSTNQDQYIAHTVRQLFISLGEAGFAGKNLKLPFTGSNKCYEIPAPGESTTNVDDTDRVETKQNAQFALPIIQGIADLAIKKRQEIIDGKPVFEIVDESCAEFTNPEAGVIAINNELKRIQAVQQPKYDEIQTFSDQIIELARTRIKELKDRKTKTVLIWLTITDNEGFQGYEPDFERDEVTDINTGETIPIDEFAEVLAEKLFELLEENIFEDMVINIFDKNLATKS